MAVPRSDDSDPVSVAITRQVKPGQVKPFEAWLDEIKAAAAGFRGYAGMDVIRPADATTPTYVIILRFASYELYSAWHDSAERAEVVERSLDMTMGAPVFEEAHGLEGWFTPPAARTETAGPPKYKMSIVTIVGLYPLIVVIGAMVTAATELPVALGTLVTVTIVAVVATYWVMPWITRSARHWLYPAETTGGGS